MKKHKKVFFLSGLLLLFVLAMVLSKYYVQVMLIQGNSMKPTYHNMSIVLVDKHSKDYTVGDVIVFTADGIKGNAVKRIVAGPFDQVQIRDGILYVNGVPSKEQQKDTLIADAGNASKVLTVPENCYFVLGDNYGESIDSRRDEIGFVAYDAIKGKILK